MAGGKFHYCIDMHRTKIYIVLSFFTYEYMQDCAGHISTRRGLKSKGQCVYRRNNSPSIKHQNQPNQTTTEQQ